VSAWSSSRTALAARVAPSWWPQKTATASLDYTLDLALIINPSEDFFQYISVAVAPSGIGELDVTNLIVDGTLLTVTLSNGQPTRVYTLDFTTTMSDGRVFDFLVYIGVQRGLPGYVIAFPPDPGYGSPVTWHWPPALDFSNPLNSGCAGLIGGLA
jgi:hypothetical protein